MNLKLERKWRKADYTIGNLYVDGKFFSNTLEDTDRGLTSSMSLSEIRKIKQPSQTAIPTGSYEITLDIVSPKFGSRTFYNTVCNGKLPRLMNVKGFDGILIHVGDGYNGKELTAGCILVGKNNIKGGLTQGKETFTNLYKLLEQAKKRGEKLYITIE